MRYKYKKRHGWWVGVVGALLLTLSWQVLGCEYSIRGEISDETYLNFKKALAENTADPITRVYLNSSGGAFFPAIAIGRLIQTHQLDVEVGRYCASSCANYLFLAGKTKYLNRRSLVVFHGGMQQDNMFQQLDHLIRYRQNPLGEKDYEGVVFNKPINREIALDIGIEDLFKQRDPASIYRDLKWIEDSYFLRLGIDPLITVYGQRGNYYALYNSKRFKGFYYDLASFKAFGVQNVKVKGGKWRPWRGDKYNKFYPVTVNMQHED